MSLPKVTFQLNTLEQEIARVFNVIKEMEFYQKNNYHVDLPQIDKKLLNKIKNCKKLTNKERVKLVRVITNEYDNFKKDKRILKIKRDLKKQEQKFFNKIPRLLKIELSEEYHVYLTQYGPGGSYWLPRNAIVKNINSRGRYTIVHEIIHLMIENLIQKYKISHWQKERMVDLYLSKIFDDYVLQNIEKLRGVKKVDGVFEKKYKLGAEKLIKAIKNI